MPLTNTSTSNPCLALQGMRVRSDGPQLISHMVQKYLTMDCSVLMGANIAGDIAREELSEAVIGYTNYDHAKLLQKVFQTQYFVVNLLPDVVSAGGTGAGTGARGQGKTSSWICDVPLCMLGCGAQEVMYPLPDVRQAILQAACCQHAVPLLQLCNQHVCLTARHHAAAAIAVAALLWRLTAAMRVEFRITVHHTHVVPCLLPGGRGDVWHPEEHRGIGGWHGGRAGPGTQQQGSHHAPGGWGCRARE
jgi:hypothetical protein